MRDLPGSLPSQRVAFKDLISVYRYPLAAGKLLRSTTTLARDNLRYSKPTGENQSYRMIYGVKNGRPVDISIEHRSAAYGSR